MLDDALISFPRSRFSRAPLPGVPLRAGNSHLAESSAPQHPLSYSPPTEFVISPSPGSWAVLVWPWALGSNPGSVTC